MKKVLSEFFKKSEILRPSVLLLFAVLLFVSVSPSSLGVKAYFVIAVSLLFFFFGEKLSNNLNLNLQVKEKTLFYFGVFLSVTALIALNFNFFTAGGFPIFNSALRRFLNPAFTYISFLLVPGVVFIIAGMKEKKKSYSLLLILFSAGMMTLLGFRTEVLAALGAGALVCYFLKIFDEKELLALFLLGILAFSGLTFIRSGGFETARTASTLSVFNFIADETPVFGLSHGYVEFSDIARVLKPYPIFGGRTLISNLIGGRTASSTTATLFGPPFLDFGFLSVFVFLFFGFVIGAGRKMAMKAKPTYAAVHSILLVFILLAVETGITDLIIWAYFFFAAIFYIISHNYEI